MTEKPQAKVTDEKDWAWEAALRWIGQEQSQPFPPIGREIRLAVLLREIAAQAKREALEKLRPFLIHRGAFHHGANCNALTKEPWGAPGGECDCGLAEAIRSFAVEPEVKERKTIVHQGPLQEDGTWHSEPEVKP